MVILSVLEAVGFGATSTYVDALPVYVRKSSLSGQKFVRNSLKNNLEKAQAHDKGKTFVSMTPFYVKNVQKCKN